MHLCIGWYPLGVTDTSKVLETSLTNVLACISSTQELSCNILPTLLVNACLILTSTLPLSLSFPPAFRT